MKVFFNPKMSIDSGGYSPSSSKPSAVVKDWQTHGLGIEICDFQPVTEDDLFLAHDRQYVQKVLSGRSSNGHGNRLPEVTNACLWTCGSMLAAGAQALIDGVACSPSSGFHHAHYASNGGFCTFNGLMMSAEKLRAEGKIKIAGIIDCDAHYGDGTDDIIEQLELHDHIKHWTFGGVFSRGRFDQNLLLDELGLAIDSMKSDGVELIVFQAGADPHEGDPLGGYMTSEEMRERDQFVFEKCRDQQIPVVWGLAGGYSKDEFGGISPVLALHRATMIECLRAFPTEGNKMTTEKTHDAVSSSPENSPAESEQTPTASSEPLKKRIQMRDTTKEKKGKMISIIGGVRAPRQD